MKLVFPHKEHDDIELIGDSFTIGTSDDATITINTTGMSDIHAKIVVDADDYFLKIDNPACMASVNGRLVKDSKEIREGDLMIIAQVHCRLESVVADAEDDNRTRIRMALPKYVLRGVSGVYFGKTFPLRGNTSLGRHSDNDIFVNVDGISRKHAVISVLANGIEIEDLDSSNGTYVNGKQITKAKISIGDEIKLDNIRFLIQSPGMQLDKKTQNFKSNETLAGRDGNAQQNLSKMNNGGSNDSAIKWIALAAILVAVTGVGAWALGLI